MGPTHERQDYPGSGPELQASCLPSAGRVSISASGHLEEGVWELLPPTPPEHLAMIRGREMSGGRQGSSRHQQPRMT